MNPRLPTMDVQQRLLQNGGRMPSGLFRQNVYRTRRGRPQSEDPMAKLVAMIRMMLRDLTNLNVRQPSTLAPPFRSQPFLYQFQLESVDIGTTFQVPIAGNLAVPDGSNAVITAVEFVANDQHSSGSGGVNQFWPNSAASTAPLWISLEINGTASPGLATIYPTQQVGTVLDQNPISGFGPLNYDLGPTPVPKLAPLPLKPGDTVSYTLQGTSSAFLARLQISGYIYPIEVEADGVRGTLADRG